MIYIEKYLPQRLNTDDDPRVMPRTDYTYGVNIRTGSAKKRGSVESTLGNLEEGAFRVLLPEGENRCVGTVSNEERLIIFIWNSNRNYCIIQYLYNTGQYSKILEWQGLNFSGAENITEVSISGSFLTWTGQGSDHEVRTLDLDNVDYRISNSSVSLIKKPPTNNLRVLRIPSGNGPNRVGKSAFMFTCRYIYQDYGKSVFGPYSELMPADSIYSKYNNNNAYSIQYEIDNEIQAKIKTLEIAARRDNSTSLEIIGRVDNPPLSGSFVFRDDQNTFPVSSEESGQNFEPIPKAKCHAHFKGRHWLANTELGYDVDDIEINLSTSPYVHTTQYVFADKLERPGSSKEIGIILYDKYLRSTGVLGSVTHTTTDFYASGTNGFVNNPMYKINANLSLSNLPSWARYFQFAVTKDKDVSLYSQIPVNYFFYVSDYDVDDDTFEIPTGMTGIQGKLFLTQKPASRSDFKFLYLQVPDNLPVLPTKEMYVKLLNKYLYDNQTQEIRIEPVLDFIDGWIVVKDFNIQNFTSIPNQFLVEVYMEGINDEIFYETGGLQKIPENASNHSYSGVIEGDSYLVSTLGADLDFKYLFTKIWEKEARDPSTNPLLYIPNEEYGGVLYAPTKSFRNSDTSEVEVSQQLERVDLTRKGFLFFKKTEKEKVYSYTFKPVAGYVLDYAKIANAYGRPNTRIYDERKAVGKTDVMFSGRFIPNSNFNDLNNFSVLDKETLNIERSPIRTLIPARDVLLAIHEKTVTSIYVGEGFVRQGEDAILAKTVGVIGDERNLAGGYGTLHPESVCEFEGNVYFWDSLKGCVCRYTTAGIYPISNIKMKDHFRKKAGVYKNLQVIGGIDPENRQYILTFPSTSVAGAFRPSETVAFNIDTETWESWYEFSDANGKVPERYANIGNLFLSFLEGQAWKHNVGRYLIFYGDDKYRYLNVMVAPAPNQNKRFNNVQVSCDNLGTNNDDLDLVAQFATPRGQETFCEYRDISEEEGVFYIPIYRNQHSRVDPGQLQIRDGEQIIDDVLEVKLRTKGNDPSSLYQLGVVFSISQYSR